MNSTLDDLSHINELTRLGLLLTRYCLMILVALGLVGNLLNVFVFLQPKFRLNPCSFYLLSAAITNLIWLSVGILIRMLSTFGLDLSERISILCKIRQFIVYTFQSLSTLFVGLATFDRFLVSNTKIEYRRMSSLRNARRLVTITTIIYCLIYADLLYCLDASGTPPQLACTSGTTRICGLYNEIARLMALVFIPCMLIFIFGYKTIRNIRQSRVHVFYGQNLRQGIRRTDRQLIQMLFGQIVLLLIAYSPHMVQRIYLVATLDTPESPLQSRIEIFWGQITLIFTAIESSLSFYIYAIFGGRYFRETVKILMKRIIRCVSNRAE